MTVCLAGFGGPKEIGVVTDRRLSLDWTSSENGFKFQRITDNWIALYSSDDMTHIDPIFRAAAQLFHEAKVAQDVDSSAQLFCKAYQRRRTQHATDLHLSVFGLTMERFLTEGSKAFNRSDHRELTKRINDVDLCCEFLIAGFDDQGVRHIFTISNPGISKHYDQIGYWAIGGGSSASISALFALNYLPFSSLGENIYKLCAAKFSGETASGVGEKTVAMALRYGKKFRGIYHEDEISTIKKKWEKEGKPKIPTGVAEHIDSLIDRPEP